MFYGVDGEVEKREPHLHSEVGQTLSSRKVAGLMVQTWFLGSTVPGLWDTYSVESLWNYRPVSIYPFESNGSVDTSFNFAPSGWRVLR